VGGVTDDAPLDPFLGDPSDPAATLDDLDTSDPAGAPLTPAEREDVLADLEDLEVFQTLLEPRGVRGIVVECEDCGESHFFGWELMRSNLRHLLDVGRTRVHEPAAEAVRHGLRPVVDPQLAEQPAGVRLHGVLGQEQLPTDLTVALALGHPYQYLQLAGGQPDVGLALPVRARAAKLDAGQRVRQRRADLRVRGVPTQVAASTAGNRRHNVGGVVGSPKDKNASSWVTGYQAPGQHDAGVDGPLGADQNHVWPFPGVPLDQVVTAGDRIYPVHPRYHRHELR
jgi:hypothetical protein